MFQTSQIFILSFSMSMVRHHPNRRCDPTDQRVALQGSNGNGEKYWIQIQMMLVETCCGYGFGRTWFFRCFLNFEPYPIWLWQSQHQYRVRFGLLGSSRLYENPWNSVIPVDFLATNPESKRHLSGLGSVTQGSIMSHLSHPQWLTNGGIFSHQFKV